MIRQLYYKIVNWSYWGGMACYGALIIGFIVIGGIILAILMV